MKKAVAFILMLTLSLSLCAPGFGVNASSTIPATYTPVSSAADLKVALEAGENVCLTADISADNAETISIAAVWPTLDLNGFSITFTNVSNNVHLFTISGTDGGLTVKDSGTGGTIEAVVATAGVSSQMFRVNSVNTLQIEGGTFRYTFGSGITTAGSTKNLVQSNGTVIVNSGTFDNQIGGQTVYGYAGTVTVNDGKFSTAPVCSGAATLTYPVGYTVSSTADAEGWHTVVPAGTGVSTADALKTALAAGGAVYLQSDITVSVTAAFPVNGATVLNLNGKTIHLSMNANVHAFNLMSGCDLTITGNGTVNYIVTANATGKAGFRVNNGATLTILNGSYTYTNDGGYSVGSTQYLVWPSAATATSAPGYTSVYGGTFDWCSKHILYAPAAGVVTVYGGTYSRAFSDNVAIAAGCELIGPDANGWYSVVEAAPFTPEVSPSYVGYTAVDSAEALKTVLTSGQKAYLTADITFSSTGGSLATTVFMNITQDTALDLNGHTVTFQVDNNKHIIQLNGGDLKIEDSSETQTGRIRAVYTNAAAYLFRVNGTDTLTVDAGIIEYVCADGVSAPASGNRNLAHSNGTVVVNGGSFDNQIGGQTLYCYAGSLIVNGGRFSAVPAYSETNTTVTYDVSYTMGATAVDGWYTLIPTGVGVTTMTELKAALEAGGNVYLQNDISADSSITISIGANTAAVLNLNQKSIHYTVSQNGVNLISVNGTGASLTVTGNGTIRNTTATENVTNVTFRVNEGLLTIKNGTFIHENPEGVAVDANRHIIFADDDVDIYGGTFQNWNANAQTLYGRNGAVITVYGGAFDKNFHTSVTLAPYHKVVLKNSRYKVLPVSVESTADIDGVFSVGYGRVDITPTESVPMAGYGNTAARMSTEVRDALYTTCMAFTDAQGDTILLFHNDLIKSHDNITNKARESISIATGIPVGQIMVTATHTHSGPDTGNTSQESIVRYNQSLIEWMTHAAIAALVDRKPAQMYTTSTTCQNLNFVRHYQLSDGSYAGDHFGDFDAASIVGHTTQADNTMQLVKFTRTGGKDIVLVNWQVHPHSYGYTTKLSSDLVGVMRSKVEQDLDCNYIYFSGASGNVNSTSKIQHENVYLDTQARGDAMANYAVGAAAGFAQVQTGNVQIASSSYTANVNKAENDKYQTALLVKEKWEQTNDYDAAMALVGDAEIHSPYHASGIVRKYEAPDTMTVNELYAFSIGDVAFAVVPYEMFTENGMTIKSDSPFAMTIVATCANVAHGYIPSAFFYTTGSYEVDSSYYAAGTAETLAGIYTDLLEGLYTTK